MAASCTNSAGGAGSGDHLYGAHLAVDSHGVFHVGIQGELPLESDQGTPMTAGHGQDCLYDLDHRIRLFRANQAAEQGMIAQACDTAPQLRLEEDRQDDDKVAGHAL